MRLTKPAKGILISGLAIRLGLASFTGHPGDMALLAVPQRLFYQTGTVDLKYFPTLPAVYYVQLLFYAPYQMLRLAGLPDFQYYYHTTMMIESLFLKLPSILCDAGIYIVILGFTRKLFPATLFFLNPFPILLTAVWGTYDSMMLFPLLLGLYAFSTRGDRTVSSLTFVVSGLFKLFGFVAFALVVCDSIIRRRFKDELPLEILGGLVLVAATVLPLFLFGAYHSFLQVIVYRFIGLSSGTSAIHYGLLRIVFKVDPSGILPTVPIAAAGACLGFSYQVMKQKQSTTILLVKWILIAAIVFNLVSSGEPQWLSWLVPLGLLYGSLADRPGLQYFAYILGVVSPFLIITLLQGTAYMLVGNSLAFSLEYVEGFSGGLLLYAIMATTMTVMFCVYMFSKKLRLFKLEVVPLVVLLYLQCYFWIVIVGVGRILGVS